MPTRARTTLAALGVVALAGAALLLTRGGDEAPAGRSALAPLEVDPGVVHVHGLGVDPADGTLYAATHSGLFRLPEGGGAQRVAHRAQDTMGFAVVGPGTFLGSGHPDPREDAVRPPLLGLIESRDAGLTWQRLSLHGRADFHSLAVGHGLTYGYDATSGWFQVTSDRTRWERRSRQPMLDLAVSPSSGDVLLATSPDGLVTSTDGGRRWELAPSAPALTHVSWPRADLLVGLDALGAVHRSPDGGRTWLRTGSLGAEPEALEVVVTDGTPVVYAAAHGRGILVSRDGGATFTVRYAQR